jgi:hypothetical protein
VTYVVTFADYTPALRQDGQPWTQALIQEGLTEDGIYTTIDTINLATLPGGVDPDPSNPATRTLTTTHATIQEGGWYKIIFQDAAGHQQATEPIQRITRDREEWAPSVGEVASLVMSRTKDKYGNELGVFNANTRPTNTQVVRLIDQMTDRVADQIGDTIPTQLWENAAGVVATRVAMQIELDFYPEQVATNRSPYQEYKAQYEEDLTRLAKQVQIVNEGGELSAISAGPSNRAQGFFPDSSKYPPYGLSTRW